MAVPLQIKVFLYKRETALKNEVILLKDIELAIDELLNLFSQPEKRYGKYPLQNLRRAIELVNKKRMAIRKAARLCGIPPQSLRDKVTGKTKIGRKSGPPTIFTFSEESLLKDHILFLAKVGYPLSRREVISLANNSALLLKKRGPNNKVGKRWFEGFLKRWPELKIGRPQKLSLKRAKASSEEIINNYFKELDFIMTKYNLKEKP